MKIISIIVSFILFNYHVNLGAAVESQSISSPQNIAKAIGRHVDVKLIDPFILATCASTGAMMGEQVNVYVLQSIIQWNNPSPNRQVHIYSREQRWDDDIGYTLGFIIGTEVGHFIVHLRHCVTDPLVPAVWNLTSTSVQASKVFVEKCVVDSTGWLLGKINGWNERMTEYIKANKKD